MNKILKTRGAGGGKGGGSSGGLSQSPDTLESQQFASVLDLVSEGEIGGLVDGLRSVYLNGTPVQNPDGSFNFPIQNDPNNPSLSFPGITLFTRNGSQTQDYIPGFPSAESEIAVGSQVLAGVPIVRTLLDQNLTAARVTISIPQLSFLDSSGNLGGTSVSLAIDVQTNGGGFIPQPLGGISWISQSIGGLSFSANQCMGIGVRVTAPVLDPSVPDFITFQVQYKTATAGAWTVLGQYQYTAGNNSSNSWDPGDPTGGPALDFYTPILPLDDYMIRVVQIASSGPSVSLNTGYSYSQIYPVTISGKSSSKYQRAYRIPLTGSPPWDIRVRRLTADSSDANLNNATYWDSYTEIVDTKLSYPNSALMALQLNSRQFSAVPIRGYDIRGIKVQIPSNYNPLTRVYTGVWDGTFVVAWTDNPAWCYYDLLTNNRYGLGDYVSANQIDKWALYSIAQYCDQMVPNGFGGKEPRFTCNLFLQTQDEAFKVLTEFTAMFRAIAYWAAGTISTSQDSPKDPVMLFTMANVTNGTFSYQGTSRSVRHTVALVTFNDPLQNYSQQVEYVPDDIGIAQRGIIPISFTAIGCTSRGQAHRAGKWLLYSERLETETVTFQAGFDGTYVFPGAIIQTVDPPRSGKRFGGRVVAATVNDVTIDAPVLIEANKTYSIYCQLPDGTIAAANVTNAPGSVSDLTIAPAFAQVPQAQSIWLLSASDLIPETWRVLTVKEVEKGKLEITALTYNPDKFQAIEEDIILQRPPTNSISLTPTPVTNLTAKESLYLVAPGVVGVEALLSWTSNQIRFNVSYKVQNGNWVALQTSSTSIDITNLQPGIYTFSVQAVNALGITSTPTSITQEILGKTAPPSDITGFYITKVGGVAHAVWDLVPDLDVQVGGQIIIRHSSLSVGATWNDGITFATFAGLATSGLLPLTTGTYMAKAVTSSNIFSTNAISFVVTEGLVTGFNTVGTQTEDPNFTGAKTDLIASGGFLQLDSGILIDSIATNIDTWGSLDSFGGIQLAGSYAFSNYLDLGTVATRRFESHITATAFSISDYMDDRSNPIDTWEAIDGGIINGTDVKLFAALTNDDPAGAPTWGAWTPFHVSDFTCRAAKFRLDFESDNPTHNIQVSVLDVVAKIPVSP